ncbi:MAG: transaldolase [Lachnospiraceae bacterium]
MKIEELKIKIFADGAEIAEMMQEYQKPYIKGFTTNPTLMKKAGIKEYLLFAKEITDKITDLPISFEVFSDDFDIMEKEAKVLSKLGSNVYIKIPITNSKGETSVPLVRKLSDQGLQLNITAIFTFEQAKQIIEVLAPNTKNILSIFAGRIMDTGIDAMPIVQEVVTICKKKPGTEVLWASCREVYNIIQANNSGADIITVTNDILRKIPSLGKDLEQFSLETVQMFARDSLAIGFSIL